MLKVPCVMRIVPPTNNGNVLKVDSSRTINMKTSQMDFWFGIGRKNAIHRAPSKPQICTWHASVRNKMTCNMALVITVLTTIYSCSSYGHAFVSANTPTPIVFQDEANLASGQAQYEMIRRDSNMPR